MSQDVTNSSVLSTSEGVHCFSLSQIQRHRGNRNSLPATQGRINVYMGYAKVYCVQVDIYGGCGNLRCPKNNQQRCLELLQRDYKFYLSFENSNCDEYITEKFWRTALK